jgi:acetyl esterase/lipase
VLACGAGASALEVLKDVSVRLSPLTREDAAEMVRSAKRKIPLAIWVGTNDEFFPLPAVRATRDALRNAGIPIQLTEIPRHTHWYYSSAKEINKEVWAFLSQHQLDADPRVEQYEFVKK